MTQISSYYASVGVSIDQKSLKAVDKYLDAIRKKIENLSAGAKSKQSFSPKLKVSVDHAAFSKSVNKSLNDIGKSASIRIKNIQFAKSDIQKGVRESLNSGSAAAKFSINAGISRDSLTAMRQQVKQALEGILIRPRLNPIVTSTTNRGGVATGAGTRRSGGRGDSESDWLRSSNPNSSRKNPWWNPMMPGGATGAFIRYGMFSLPFVGGAMGINSLLGKATQLEGQQLALKTASAGDQAMMLQQQSVVNSIGEKLGVKTSTMMPFYAQMFAGSRGTAMEAKLPEGFENFMKYSSVTGANEENMKGAIRAMSQMVAKGQIYAEEAVQQMAEHNMPEFMNILADVAAGGDRNKLIKMMQDGQLDTITYLPKVLAVMGERASKSLKDYYGSIQYQSNLLGRTTEKLMESFLAQGGKSGLWWIMHSLNNLMASSNQNIAGYAKAFETASRYFASGVLHLRDWVEYISYAGQQDNVFTKMFGEAKDNKFVDVLYKAKDAMKGLLTATWEIGTAIRASFGGEIIKIIDFALSRMMEGTRLLVAGAQAAKEGASVTERVMQEMRLMAQEDSAILAINAERAKNSMAPMTYAEEASVRDQIRKSSEETRKQTSTNPEVPNQKLQDLLGRDTSPESEGVVRLLGMGAGGIVGFRAGGLKGMAAGSVIGGSLATSTSDLLSLKANNPENYSSFDENGNRINQINTLSYGGEIPLSYSPEVLANLPGRSNLPKETRHIVEVKGNLTVDGQELSGEQRQGLLEIISSAFNNMFGITTSATPEPPQ